MPKKQTQTARYAAAEVLCRLYQTKLPVKIIFDKTVTRYHLIPAEKNLTMQLVYGVLRQRQYLDRILEILSTTPLGKIEPFIHQTIIIGLYQLYFLERIPESAAVNEAVNSCRRAHIPKRLHGFVNGILRQSIRRKTSLKSLAQTDKNGKEILNHPKWLTQKWEKHYGAYSCHSICASNSKEPVLVLRVNRAHQSRDVFQQKLDEHGIKNCVGNYAPEAVILPEFSGQISTIPGYAEGAFQVQDEAAQLATPLLCPLQSRGKYLDGCAGLGSKTAHLLERGSGDEITVHAVEPDPHRQTLFTQNMSRLALNPLPVLHRGYLQQFSAEKLPLFDGIIIDAPCSGTGVTGRHPDIRWNRKAQDLVNYQKEQLSLLSHSATLLAPKGVLVYATCSLEPEENSEVINVFLADNRDFILTDCSQQLPEAAHKFVVNRCFAPHPSEKIDGFFAARLERRQ